MTTAKAARRVCVDEDARRTACYKAALRMTLVLASVLGDMSLATCSTAIRWLQERG